MYGPEAQLPVDINIDMAKVMGVFLAQLRLVPVSEQFNNRCYFVKELMGLFNPLYVY